MPTISKRECCTLFIFLVAHNRTILVEALSAPQRSYRTSGRVAPYGRPEFSSRDCNTYMMGPPKITSRCSCGGASVLFPNCLDPYAARGPSTSIIDCHCPSCRRFHVTSFVRYLEMPENDVLVQGDTVVRFKDSCLQAGPVMRTYCRRCYSKLLTTPIKTSGYGSNNALVNMGPIDEETVPADLMQQWKTVPVTNWRADKAPAWTYGLPHYVLQNPTSKQTKQRFDEILSPVTVTGGCTCGTVQYKFRISRRTELQHCYCSLCRQLSGGPYMTWVPVRTKDDDFGWYIQGSVTKINWSTPQRASAPEQERPATVSSDSVPLVRYTKHAQRHVCAQCGGVLSIVYDNDNFDDEMKGTSLWLAAGSFDGIRFPSSHVERYLDRVVHICCRYNPEWYNIPNDGMQRVEEAS